MVQKNMQRATDSVVTRVKKLKDGFDDFRLESRSINKGPTASRPHHASLGNLPTSPHSDNYAASGQLKRASDLRSRLNRRFLGQNRDLQTDRYGRRMNSSTINEEGVDFKAKLIGIQDVPEARGDFMCQNTMQACKESVRRSGQRKQRIWFNLSSKGFKIKDQKTEVVLFNFPITKISFIAKDITDDRAFGFVYEGMQHRTFKFYGIKTEKPAEFVVMDIRDTFQMVYESTCRAKDNLNRSGSERPELANEIYSTIPSFPNSPLASEKNKRHSIGESSTTPNSNQIVMTSSENHRVKSSTEISHFDQLLSESNDLIVLNHMNDGKGDMFDFDPLTSKEQSYNKNPFQMPVVMMDSFGTTKPISENFDPLFESKYDNNAAPKQTAPTVPSLISMPNIPPRSGALLPAPNNQIVRQRPTPKGGGSGAKSPTAGQSSTPLSETLLIGSSNLHKQDDPFADDFFK